MMVWVLPFAFVVFIIIWICIWAERKTASSILTLEETDEVGEEVVEHPFTINPIIWVMIIAAVFISFVIMYYAASFL